MAKRKSVHTGRPSEDFGGYCRAISFDNPSKLVIFGGTAATNPDGSIAYVGDVYAQTRLVLEMMKENLEKLGSSMKDVVRTRIYVVDIRKNSEAAARAHGEFFRDIRPTSTMIGTDGLAHPDMLVELDADAVI